MRKSLYNGERMLIWRYEEGYIVDSETGVVVDIIYDDSPYPGNNEPKPYIGTASGLGELQNTMQHQLLRKLRIRSLKDERGTYVAYQLGLTKKSVMSLKRIDEEMPELDDELKEEFERWLRYINRKPRLASRTMKVKKALALLLASRSLGRGASVKEVAKIFKVNERHLRKLVVYASRNL